MHSEGARRFTAPLPAAVFGRVRAGSVWLPGLTLFVAACGSAPEPAEIPQSATSFATVATCRTVSSEPVRLDGGTFVMGSGTTSGTGTATDTQGNSYKVLF